jgi:hypothetical protein
VAEEVDPPAADGVEITPPLEVVEPDPFGPPNGDERKPFMILHLGTGVPEVAQIPLHEFPVGHGHSFGFEAALAG